MKTRNQHPIPVIIYSNDWEVQQVTRGLSEIVLSEYIFTCVYISWKVGFQLLAEMYLLKEALDLQSDLENIFHFTITDYHKLRKKNQDQDQIIGLLESTIDQVISDYKNVGRRTEQLEKKVKELLEKQGAKDEDFEEYVKKTDYDNECESKLLQAIELINKNQFIQSENVLNAPEMKNYIYLMKTYNEITKNKVDKLHTYYNDWNKILTNKNTYVNLDIKKRLDRDIFTSLVTKVVELFKDNELEASHMLSMGILPLMAGVQWSNNEDQKYLEKFYIIGLYLALFLENYAEYSEIIDLLKVVIEEKTCESELIAQHIEFARMIRGLTETCSINYQFKNQMIQNITQFYLARRWTLVWNLLLPLWNILDKDDKKQCKRMLEDAYAMDLKPPTRFEDFWEKVNEKEKIIKGENLGKLLLDTEAERIKKGEVVDFLLGEHLVIDTTMIGRSHAIIYVKSKNSRFGIQIDSNDIDLSNAHTIEFTEESISQYIKSLKPDEKKYYMSGIIKLTKEPQLKIVWRKVDLENVLI